MASAGHVTASAPGAASAREANEGDLISSAIERDHLTDAQVQGLLLQMASDVEPFEPPTVRGEVV